MTLDGSQRGALTAGARVVGRTLHWVPSVQQHVCPRFEGNKLALNIAQSAWVRVPDFARRLNGGSLFKRFGGIVFG